MNPHDERRRHVEAARSAFTRAAAALTEWPGGGGDPLAFALLEGAFALHELAKADTEDRAREKVVSQLRALRATRAARERGP